MNVEVFHRLMHVYALGMNQVEEVSKIAQTQLIALEISQLTLDSRLTEETRKKK
jgi:hypothetical protein